MAAHRLPLCLTRSLGSSATASSRARRWLALPHAQATSGHRRSQDTAHRYTCRRARKCCMFYTCCMFYARGGALGSLS
eukprot:765234-Prymnesium_polylepis.1